CSRCSYDHVPSSKWFEICRVPLARDYPRDDLAQPSNLVLDVALKIHVSVQLVVEVKPLVNGHPFGRCQASPSHLLDDPPDQPIVKDAHPEPGFEMLENVSRWVRVIRIIHVWNEFFYQRSREGAAWVCVDITEEFLQSGFHAATCCKDCAIVSTRIVDASVPIKKFRSHHYVFFHEVHQVGPSIIATFDGVEDVPCT